MGLFSTSIQLKYLGGHPKIAKARDVVVKKAGAGIVLDGGFLGPKVEIPKVMIRGLQLGVGHKRSAGKAVAGAVVAGVLTGGLGALAGAAIGGRRREDNTATLFVEIDGVEYGIQFGDCNGDKYAKLASLIA